MCTSTNGLTSPSLGGFDSTSFSHPPPPPRPHPTPITERGNKFWKSKYSVIFLPLTLEFLIVLLLLRHRFALNFGINVGSLLNLRLQLREMWWKETFTHVGNENLPNLTATILPEWRANARNVHRTHPTDAAQQFLQKLTPPPHLLFKCTMAY